MSEIVVNTNISVKNGAFNDRFNPGAQRISQTAQGGGVPGSVIVGFAAEQVIDLSGLTTPGWIMFQNLDTVNFVTWGPFDSTMAPLGQILPNETAIFRLSPGVQLAMQADTADCLVMIKAYED